MNNIICQGPIIHQISPAGLIKTDKLILTDLCTFLLLHQKSPSSQQAWFLCMNRLKDIFFLQYRVTVYYQKYLRIMQFTCDFIHNKIFMKSITLLEKRINIKVKLLKQSKQTSRGFNGN